MFFQVKYGILAYSISWIGVFGYLAPVLPQFVGYFSMVDWVPVIPIGPLVIMIGQSI